MRPLKFEPCRSRSENGKVEVVMMWGGELGIFLRQECYGSPSIL